MRNSYDDYPPELIRVVDNYFPTHPGRWQVLKTNRAGETFCAPPDRRGHGR